MMDSNEDIIDEGAFASFAQNNDLIDIATQFDPLLAQSPTYLHSSKRLDYILLSPHLAELAIKADHHQFHQHVVSDHKGVYVHFRAEDLFDTDTMDRSQMAYRRLRLCRRDIVEKYIAKLEQLFEEHHLLPRAEALASRILSIKDPVVLQSCMETFDNLDKERTAYMIAAEKFAGRPPPSRDLRMVPVIGEGGQDCHLLEIAVGTLQNGWGSLCQNATTPYPAPDRGGGIFGIGTNCSTFR